jgi:hypothetical protein
VDAGERIKLSVTNLEEGLQEFRFVDLVQASYKSAGSYATAAGERRIEIDGIDGKSRAYFYGVASLESEERMIQIRTEVK